MIRFIAITLTLCALMFGGCGQPDEIIHVEYRAVTLIDVSPPKHFYVSIRDNYTGAQFYKIFVSKHCNDHYKSAKIGRTYYIAHVTTRSKSHPVTISHHWSRQSLHEVFCEGGYLRPLPPGVNTIPPRTATNPGTHNLLLDQQRRSLAPTPTPALKVMPAPYRSPPRARSAPRPRHVHHQAGLAF